MFGRRKLERKMFEKNYIHTVMAVGVIKFCVCTTRWSDEMVKVVVTPWMWLVQDRSVRGTLDTYVQ